MTVETIIYPDAKAAVVAYLNGALDVEVYSRVPMDERPRAFVRILSAGGEGAVESVLSDVAFTVESWDNDEDKAHDTAQQIRGALRSAYLMAGMPVYGYREWGPPVDLPDESGQPRYTFTFSIRFRPV